MLKTKFIIVCAVLIISGLAQFLGCGKDNNESPPQNTEDPRISNVNINPPFAYAGSGTQTVNGYWLDILIAFDYHDTQADIRKLVMIEKNPTDGPTGTSTSREEFMLPIYGSQSGTSQMNWIMNTSTTVNGYPVTYTLEFYLIDEKGHASNTISIKWPLYPR